MRRYMRHYTRRLIVWSAVLFALVALIGLAGAGSTSKHVSAATAQATVAATESGTAEPGDTSTEDNNPISFVQAPAPDAGTIGISLGDSDKSIRLQTVLENGPAWKAGLQIGDEIVAINGKPTPNRQSVISAIVASKAGNRLTFTVNRKGKKKEIKVSVSTRRAVYCPLAAPTSKAGKAVVKDPIIAEKNWAITQGGSEGVALTFKDGKMGFVDRGQGGRWAGLATLKNVRIPDYIYNVEITQSSQSVGGVILNYRSGDGFYLLQLIPNGSWTMSAIFNDGSTGGGLSFSEPSLKAADESDPNSTATNQVTVQVEDNNIYISFNGEFACGTALTQFGDPPIQRGAEGVFAIVYNNLSNTDVSFGKISLTDLGTAATPGATQAATAAGTPKAK